MKRLSANRAATPGVAISSLLAAPPRGHALQHTLPDFGVSRALMLQGPAGPFFRRLGQELRDHGVSVTKVNLHAGDVIFYPGPDTLPYRGRLADFETWVAQQLRERAIDGVFLCGDCRAYHKAAINAARAAGVAVWVFEEGYLRPDWITYERDGVNGHSRMSRDPRFFLDAYRAAGSPPEPEALPVGDTFSQGAWYSTANAIAYTPAGGRVTARCGCRDSGAPFVEVDDDGPGIPPAERERIFERFYRVGGSGGGGTGLGLAIVKEMAERHRAEVFVDSGADGRGTRFRVVFPAPEPAPA